MAAAAVASAAAASAAAATAAGRARAEGGGDVPSPPLPPSPRGQRADILDEVARKELCTDTFCKVCGAVLQFESQRIAHYEGKKHAQKVRLYLQMHGEQKEGQDPGKQKAQYVNFQVDPNVDKNSYCRLCNMIFTSPIVAQSHYLGKIHSKKLRQLSGDQCRQSPQGLLPESGISVVPALLEQTTENASPDSSAKGTPSSCSNSLDLDDPDRYCQLCSAPFNNPVMAHQHYVGKKHKRNEARKKLLAEMGTEAVPVESKANAVGVGKYICPICNISLTSIEMYQSHMQGNKHHVKETMIVNLMSNSKKTYSSFEDELADYIKVQRARGLEPRVNFRRSDEECQNKEHEAMNGHKSIVVSDQDQFSSDIYEPDHHSIFFSEIHTPLHSFQSRLSHRSPPERDPFKREDASTAPEKLLSQLTTYKRDHCSLASSESSNGYQPISLSNCSNSCRRRQKCKTVKKEREGAREGQSHPSQQSVKRRQDSEEETDSGKDGEKKKRKKDKVDSAAESKSKHGKDKGNKRAASEKESRKHKKEKKKKAKASGPTEEEILWNESILGF